MLFSTRVLCVYQFNEHVVCLFNLLYLGNKYMGVQNIFLDLMLHFTPFCYLICGALLLMRRKDGDKSRILLVVSIFAWGGSMLTSLIYHYNDAENTVQPVLSMVSLNITLFIYFVMLLYPIEIVKPGLITIKSTLLLFSIWIALNLFLLITAPDFRRLLSFDDVVEHIGEYNVLLRLAVAALILFLSCITAFLPYKFNISRVDIRWIRWFCFSLLVGASLYTIWLLTDSDFVRLLIQICCLFYCLCITYQELYVRFTTLPEQSVPINIEYDTLSVGSVLSASELWLNLEKVMAEQKPWLNPDLTLADMVSMVHTNRTTFARTIRENGYDGFSSFINQRRIQQFIRIIETEQVDSINETFFAVGFRSKTTALRHFREHTGMTPTEYIQKRLLDNGN